MDLLIEKAKELNYFEDLYSVPREIFRINIENKTIKLKKEHYSNINIGLLNVPCGGFGDIIACKTFHDYLIQWYPTANIYICTTNIDGYRSIGVNTKNMIQLTNKGDIDCPPFDKLKIPKKIKFDILINVPVVKRTFYIDELIPLIPYATYFNTFTVSEYNGLLGPYTMPIGVCTSNGQSNMGLLLNDMKVKKHNIIKSPYAVIYIQPPGPSHTGAWGVHGNYCFLTYIHMICKKYKYRLLSIIIPGWITDIIRCYVTDPQPGTCYKVHRLLKEYTKNYGKIILIDENNINYIIKDDGPNKLILRGDILPKPRDQFISLIKYSIKDVLLTGDQSITDALSCCRTKNIWYQIAPWKIDFAKSMAKHIPNKYYESYRTSCGSIKAINYNSDYNKLLKNFDFRKNGKSTMDSIILANYYKNEHHIKSYMKIVNNSRTINSVINKLEKYKI